MCRFVIFGSVLFVAMNLLKKVSIKFLQVLVCVCAQYITLGRRKLFKPLLYLEIYGTRSGIYTENRC